LEVRPDLRGVVTHASRCTWRPEGATAPEPYGGGHTAPLWPTIQLGPPVTRDWPPDWPRGNIGRPNARMGGRPPLGTSIGLQTCPATPPCPSLPRPLTAAPATLALVHSPPPVAPVPWRAATHKGHLGPQLSATARGGKGSGASKRALDGGMHVSPPLGPASGHIGCTCGMCSQARRAGVARAWQIRMLGSDRCDRPTLPNWPAAKAVAKFRCQWGKL
jgi:hypothetical protein